MLAQCLWHWMTSMAQEDNNDAGRRGLRPAEHWGVWVLGQCRKPQNLPLACATVRRMCVLLLSIPWLSCWSLTTNVGMTHAWLRSLILRTFRTSERVQLGLSIL